MKNVVLIPNASNLIESLRSIGYSFETALADITDNCIAANASLIDIYANIDKENSYVNIVDNGIGMNEEELIDSLRYGSKNPNEHRDEKDMGRFGLGLKSASISLCRTLTVISKKDNKVNGVVWDLDYIEKTNNWTLKILSHDQIEKIDAFHDLDKFESGTVVRWENFDKLKQSSSNFDESLRKLVIEAKYHLSLIYHRLIGNNLKILVNNDEIKKLDPFLENNTFRQVKRTSKIKVENEEILVTPIILPHLSKLSEAEIEQVGGKESLRNKQGFYIYRNKRLIIWGTWFRIGEKSELTKLARVIVDVPNSLDYIWELDVKKSSVNLPERIKPMLYRAVNDSCSVSEEVFDYKGRTINTDFIQTWNIIKKRKNDGLLIKVNQENPLLIKFMNSLSKSQLNIFKSILKDFENDIPLSFIYKEYAKGHVDNKELNIEDKDLLFEQYVQRFYDFKNIENSITKKTYVDIISKKNEVAFDEYIIKRLNEWRLKDD